MHLTRGLKASIIRNDRRPYRWFITRVVLASIEIRLGNGREGAAVGGGLDGITEIWTMRCRSVGSKIGASVRLNGRESKWPLTTATRSERRQTGVSPRSVSRRNWTREGHFVTVATRYPSLPPSFGTQVGTAVEKKRKKMENLDGSKGYFLSDTPLVRVQRDDESSD